MEVTAERFVERLEALPTPVRMGDIFALAREFIDLPLDDIDQLMQSPEHHRRVGALSIMGKQFNRKATTEARRAELYDLNLRRTDRINTWHLVDLSGHHVVGGFLFNKPRTVLYELARSSDWWKRRGPSIKAIGRISADSQTLRAVIFADRTIADALRSRDMTTTGDRTALTAYLSMFDRPQLFDA